MTEPTKKPKDPRTITLKGVRLSFTDALYEKRAKSPDNPDKKTHHLNILLETSGPGSKYTVENKAKITEAMKAAGLKEWKDENAYKVIAEDNPKRVAYRKGDKFKNKEGKIYAGYEGNFAFGASGPGGGQRRPILRDKYKRGVAEKDILEVFYSGAYADVIVSWFGTEKGSRGIFAVCELIRSWQEGEHMAAGYVLDEDDLDELDDFDGDDSFEDAGSSSAGSQAPVDDDPFA